MLSGLDDTSGIKMSGIVTKIERNSSNCSLDKVKSNPLKASTHNSFVTASTSTSLLSSIRYLLFDSTVN